MYNVYNLFCDSIKFYHTLLTRLNIMENEPIQNFLKKLKLR